MRFIADGMLGKLAKWLRLLGYDVLYSPYMDDPELARIAYVEDRILLTRDTQLVKRKGIKFVLVESDHVDQQLRQIVTELHLGKNFAAFSRCPECNTELIEVEAESVRGVVPPYVLATQSRFRRCPKCLRVYWRGTHWEHIQEKMRSIEAG